MIESPSLSTNDLKHTMKDNFGYIKEIRKSFNKENEIFKLFHESGLEIPEKVKSLFKKNGSTTD